MGLGQVIKAPARGLSKLIANSPGLLFGIQEAWLRIGYKFFDLEMATWVVRGHEWLRTKPGPQHNRLVPLGTNAPAYDQKMAERIIASTNVASQIAQQDGIPDESIWGELRQAHYARLTGLVQSGDIGALANHLATLLRTEAVNGYTYGTTFDSWPHRWNYLPLQIELSVVQLAESLGFLRAECPEQGERAFWRKITTEEKLIARLEEHFGFRIEQPRFGDPHGIMFGGRFLTRETCSHLHAAYRMAEALQRSDVSKPYRIVEIGGGFGGTCFWLRKILGDDLADYAIVDLPETGLVQSAFYGAVAPEKLVLRGEKAVDISQPIYLVPHFDIEKIEFEPNVVINQDSMPEMPEAEVRRYLDWAAQAGVQLFISFNQETYSASHGILQNNVSEICRDYPALQRVSRNYSWDRRGYVEEVYKVASR